MPTVYIVEDDITLRDELARLLELNGYETRACSDFSRAAIDIVAANPDCVILDLGLPGADGQSICRDIRREAEMPIIILTAKSDEFTEVMSLNLGAHDFIAKPYRPAVLLARVASLIKRSSSAALPRRVPSRMPASRSTSVRPRCAIRARQPSSRETSSASSPCSCAARARLSRARTSCVTCGIRTRSSTTTRLRSISTAYGRRSRRSASKIIWPRIAAADTRCRRML